MQDKELDLVTRVALMEDRQMTTKEDIEEIRNDVKAIRHDLGETTRAQIRILAGLVVACVLLLINVAVFWGTRGV